MSRHSPGGDDVYECSEVNDYDEAESVAIEGERAWTVGTLVEMQYRSDWLLQRNGSYTELCQL